MKKLLILIFITFTMFNCSIPKNTTSESNWKLEGYTFEQIEAYLDSIHNIPLPVEFKN